MKSKKVLLALVIAVVFASAGSAQEPITVIELIDHLEEAVRDCDWKARNMTGAPKIKMLLHKRTMEDVLEALRAGRAVDPKKLETALKVHPS